jgi:hypothetical protein
MLLLANGTLQTMKRTLLLASLSFFLCISLCMTAALGLSGPAVAPASASGQYAVQGRAAAGTPQQGGQPVSYSSMTQLNGLLEQLEARAKNTQADLSKLRIERWKTDGGSKKQVLANVDSIQRNLQGALPEIIAQMRSQPEDLPATFKLYRNLDALYDVLGNVVEVTGAFGSKDDFQSLSNDLSTFESTRKQLAQRIENLSSAKEAEIVRLRTDLKTAQAAIPAAPPKKIVVDDNEPAKKPAVKKKAKPKAPTPATPTGQTPQALSPAKPQ